MLKIYFHSKVTSLSEKRTHSVLWNSQEKQEDKSKNTSIREDRKNWYVFSCLICNLSDYDFIKMKMNKKRVDRFKIMMSCTVIVFKFYCKRRLLETKKTSLDDAVEIHRQ